LGLAQEQVLALALALEQVLALALEGCMELRQILDLYL